MRIHISPELREKCPALTLGCIQSRVRVAPSDEGLLTLLDEQAEVLAATLSLDEISRLEVIHATREAYKATGKKPGRYRPSAEALLRRIVSGKGLYRINNVVDLLNYLSITTHFSIGGYDLDRIAGDVEAGIAREAEPYEAIARGPLNIEGLPVLRDALGAFGTPTSDSERTQVRPQTTHFLMVVFNFGGHPGLEGICQEAVELLGRFAAGGEREWWIAS